MESILVEQLTGWNLVQEFFGHESIDPIRAWLAEMRASQQALPNLAASLAGAQVALNLERADKGDDLDGAAENIEVLQDRLDLLEEEKIAVGCQRDELARRLDTHWYRFWYAVSFRTNRKHAELGELDEKVDLLLRRLANGRFELKDGRLQEQQLLAPIRDLQQECSRLESEIDTHEKRINQCEHQLRQAFLAVVKTDPGLPDRLLQVAASTTAPDFFQAVMTRLGTALTQERTLEQQLVQAEKSVTQEDDTAEKALNQLAFSVASGFHVNSVPATASVRLVGNVSFSGDASGTATGTGNGSAEYQVDQINWAPDQGLAVANTAFSAAYADMGAAHAQRDRIVTRLECCQQAIVEYLTFISQELTPQAAFPEGEGL